ncbi:MAG TPA: DUF222 domain-containing protein [Mycobacteriales bacterium]|nr:DUF222 domain-containing protein [Mycobacteriales bacterium]
MFASAVVDLRAPRQALPTSARLALLHAAAPGPEVIAELAAIDVTTLGGYDQVVLLQTWERQRHWLDAATQPVLTAVGGPDPGEKDWGREEIAAALALSKMTAGRRLDTARQLTAVLARTLDALRAGQLSYYHAAHLAAETAALPDTLARRVEALALPHATGTVGRAGEGLGAFRRTVARAVLTVDADHTDRNHRNLIGDRTVRSYNTGAGTATVTAENLPADKAALVMAVLRARAAKTGPDDPRSRDQRLADAYLAIFEDAHDRLDLPLQHGRRPVTSLVFDFPSWAGLANSPGYLDGYGPIPAAMARRIADESDLRRLITDPLTGHLLDSSPRTYRPSQALADHTIDRYRTCDAPNCNRPARSCDLDHTQPFSHHGTTTRANLHPVCERDHPLRHEGGWQLSRAPDNNNTTWTSPTGHTYTTTPWDYRPLE